MDVSFALLCAELGLFLWHRFGRRDRSDIAMFVLLIGVLATGIAFAQIADGEPGGPRLATQVLVLAASVGVHMWAMHGPADQG